MKIDALNNPRLRLALTIVITLSIFAILALFFSDFVREVLVVPIYQIIWFGDLLAKSISQEIYLAALILVSIVIALNTFSKMRGKAQAQRIREAPTRGDSRYRFWARQYHNLTYGKFFSSEFTLETRKLILSILAYQENLSVADVERMVANDALAVPDVVKTLIERKEINISQRASARENRLISWLRALIDRSENSPTDEERPPTDPQVAEIINFIEQRLEITNAANEYR